MRCTARWRHIRFTKVCAGHVWVYKVCIDVSYLVTHPRDTSTYIYIWQCNSHPKFDATIICISNLLPFLVFKHMMPCAICKWWHFPMILKSRGKRILLHIRWFVTRPFGMRCGTIAVWSLSLVYYQTRTNVERRRRRRKQKKRNTIHTNKYVYIQFPRTLS